MKNTEARKAKVRDLADFFCEYLGSPLTLTAELKPEDRGLERDVVLELERRGLRAKQLGYEGRKIRMDLGQERAR